MAEKAKHCKEKKDSLQLKEKKGGLWLIALPMKTSWEADQALHRSKCTCVGWKLRAGVLPLFESMKKKQVEARVPARQPPPPRQPPQTSPLYPWPHRPKTPICYFSTTPSGGTRSGSATPTPAPVHTQSGGGTPLPPPPANPAPPPFPMAPETEASKHGSRRSRAPSQPPAPPPNP